MEKKGRDHVLKSKKRKIKVIALLMLPLALFIGAAAFMVADSTDIHFEDENLEMAVREEIGIPEGTIRKEDLEAVDTLDLSNSGIESLKGIENVMTVRDLDLQGNRIEDIAPLEELIYLENLNLRGNHVEDLSKLKGLERMTTLDIRDTGIDDLSFVSGMHSLTDLNVRGNNITSLAPLENLSELRTLNARNNHIKNIRVLTNLAYLEDVNLRNNQIKDFSPVFELPHLTQRLYVTGNPGVDMKKFVPLFEQVEKMDIEDPDLALLFNKDGGVYQKPQTVELHQLLGNNGTIRYTTNGSEPAEENEQTKEYTGPIDVEETTVVKAKFYDQYGNAGDMVSNTYVIGESSNFPVVSISSSPAAFFSEATGIYAKGANFDKDAPNPDETANYAQSGDLWEREATVEMYKPDGTEMIHQQAGVRLHGNTSRYYPKKSFRLYARSDYSSENTFSYPIFNSEDDNEYNRLLLRNSGNDWGGTLFRDAFMQELIDGFDLEKQAYEPAQLYINGEYWGIYNLRERIDDDYFEYKYGILEDNIDYLENNANVRIGNNRHYEKMLDYIENNDITDPKVYAHVTELLDINNFIDYNAAEIFMRNTDWPSNNNRYWREKPNGKWRWTVFDLDFGFGLVGGDHAYTHQTLDFATESGNDSWPNADWSTFLLRNLLKNEEFRSQFVGTFTHYLNTHFDAEKVTTKLDEFEAMYEPEMKKNIERWDKPESMEDWKNSISEMREFGSVRDKYVYAHFIDHFNLDGYADLHFQVEDGHSVEIYGEEVPLENGKWSGRYLTDVPLEIRVDGKPAQLSRDHNDIAVEEGGRLTPLASSDAKVELAGRNGNVIGSIQVKGTPVAKQSATLEAGTKWNWQDAVDTDGAYASFSGVETGTVNGETFSAEQAGEGLLTVHNSEDEVEEMVRIEIVDPADEARVYNEDNPAAKYNGSWQDSTNEEHHEGTASFTETEGDSVSITFDGTGIRWLGFKGNTQGIAEVSIDGRTEKVDTFAEKSTFHTELYAVNGLEPGRHTLRITATGEQNEKAVNQRLHIDSFEILKKE